MNTSLQKPSHLLFAVLVFYSLLCLPGCGAWGVIETSEARYAEISREMFRSGDWMHPKLLGIYHYHKPPMVYWITSAGYHIFGVNAWGTRFFLQLAFLAQIALVYHITAIITGDKMTGAYAAVIYSGLPIVLASMRGLTTDAYLNTFILGSIYCWLQWRNVRGTLWLYLVALMLGMAFLTKGPVALVVPLLVGGGLNRVVSNGRFTLHHAMATLVFCTVALSWFAALVVDNKAFVDYFLFRHTLERYTHAEVFTRSEPWWYYLAFAPLLALPWLIVLPFGWRAIKWNQVPFIIKRVVVFWLVIPLLFFSLSSSKLVLYVLPLYAGLAIVGAWYLGNLHGRLHRFENAFMAFIVFIGVALSVACFFEKTISPRWVAALPAGLVVPVIVIRRWSDTTALARIMIYSLLFSGFLILFSAFVFSHNALRFNSTAPLAAWIEQNRMEDRTIVVYNRLLPSLAFHLDKDIISVSDGNRYLNREVQFEHHEAWRNSLFHLKETEDASRLKSVLSGNCILIVKGDIGKEAAWLTQGFAGRVPLGGWTIYY